MPAGLHHKGRHVTSNKLDSKLQTVETATVVII